MLFLYVSVNEMDFDCQNIVCHERSVNKGTTDIEEYTGSHKLALGNYHLRAFE